MFAFVVDYKDKEHVFLLEPSKSYLIGRNNDNDIIIKEQTVSGKHARLDVDNTKVYIEDLKSSNGTKLNKVKISKKTKIALNQHINIGRSLCYLCTLTNSDINSLKKIKNNIFIRNTSLLSKINGNNKKKLDTKDKSIESNKSNKSNKSIELDNNIIVNKLNLNASKNKITIDKLIAKKNDTIIKNYAFHKLDILYKTSQRLNNVMKEAELFKLTLEQIRNGVDYDRGYILIREDDELVCKYNANEDDELVISKTISNKVIDEQIGIITIDAGEDKRFDTSKSIADFSITSAMCVPIWVKEKAVGLIYIDNSICSRQFNDEDLKFLTAFSYQLSSSLERIKLMESLQEEEKIKSRLQRYFSPEIANVIIKNPKMIQLGGMRTNVSVFFADIRGFTKLSLSTSVDLLVNILNEYFTNLVKIIFDYKGTVDKFMGDAVMAFFGAPIPYNNYEWYAVKSAIMIQNEIASFQDKWQKKYGFNFNIGIGISSGEVIAGNVGSADRMDYTIMGNTVNLASRICSKAPKGEIYICENTFKNCKNKIKGTELDKIKLKGINKDISIYKIDFK